MRVALALLLLSLATAGFAARPVVVTLTAADGAKIRADVYASVAPGFALTHGVVLAHGGRYTRGSWRAQAKALNARGFLVIAPDFRGRGESTGPGSDDLFKAPLHLDLLAAARHLRDRGAKTVAIVGGSLGGMAAGDALLNMNEGEIDRVVFLGSPATLSDADVTAMPGRKLFIVARDDASGDGTRRLPRIQADYDAVPAPRELRVLEGDAHAQALFETSQGPAVLDIIVRFLADE
jgi:pimeloyl-ACP methyl ester carboxylesterase